MFAQIASGVLHSLFGKFFERPHIIAPDQLDQFDQQFTLLPVFDFVEVSLVLSKVFTSLSTSTLHTAPLVNPAQTITSYGQPNASESIS